MPETSLFSGPLTTQKSQGQKNAERGVSKTLSLHVEQQDCTAITLTPTMQVKAGQDKWAWCVAGLKQAASRQE